MEGAEKAVAIEERLVLVNRAKAGHMFGHLFDEDDRYLKARLA
jgi:hypothetical protein